MKRLGTMLLGAVVLVAAGTVLLSAGRLARARAHFRAAESLLEVVARDAGRVLDLRESRQTVAEQKRPEQDVIARVNAVLAEAGLEERHFGGLRPESDSSLPGNTCRRQTIRITLRQLGLSELGAFLERWAASQELWTPVRIELSHVRTEAREDRYEVVLLVAATYLAEQ